MEKEKEEKNNLKNELQKNIKKDINDNNIIAENETNQSVVKNIIIRRDLSNKNNNSIYISQNNFTKSANNVNNIIQNDKNNNTIYISNYCGNNKNNNGSINNTNIHYRKNSEILTSTKIYLKNDFNNNFSKSNNPINNIYSTDIKNNNEENSKFKNIKNSSVEKINLNLYNERNRNFISGDNINLEKNKDKDKQVFDKKINSINENNNIIIKKNNVKNDPSNNILSQSQNNIININMKINQKKGFYNNSQKITDIKSYSNIKTRSKDYSKVIGKISNKNNNSPNKFNQNNKINIPLVINKENNNIINLKNFNRNNSSFIKMNKSDFNKNKIVNISSQNNLINSYNKNKNNLFQFTKSNNKPSKIIIQNVVIENNAINNNIFFSGNEISPNNILINSFKAPFDLPNNEPENITNNIYIPNLQQTTEIKRNIIYPINENDRYFYNINKINRTERERRINLKKSNNEINKKQVINSKVSSSRNTIKSAFPLKHSNSDFISNSVEKLISSDKKSSSKLIVINSSIKEKRMDNIKGRSKSLLSDRPKAKCTICSKLIETHLLQIHINAHPSEVFKWLYLGTFTNACDIEELRRINIKYILNCAIECKNKSLPKDIQELHLKIRDNKTFDIIPFFQQANEFINQAKSVGGNILIHCKLGISRSAAIIIAYLIKYYGFDFNSAMKFIKKQRDRINPNVGFIEQLKKYENMVKNKIKNK